MGSITEREIFSHKSAQMSPHVLHFTENILTFVPFGASLRGTCVCGKEQAKSFHTILNIPKPHFPPKQMGRGAGTCLLLQCVCCCQQPRRVPSPPKNEQKFTQLPPSSHCEVTDTFSLTPCARHPPSCELLLAPSPPRIS